MDFRLRRLNLNAVAQGVGGLVFGSEQSSSNEDSYVQRYLDRISNGVLAEDRRSAMVELQSLVAESRSAQLAFSASGLPVVMTVLREEREDVEMIRGALETLVSAVTSIDSTNQDRNEVHAASMNADLLSREPESIPLLINLLSEDDFYIRYYTLQLLTALLSHSHSRLQETILSIPRGITCLMDMLMDREVIRNEALLLLTHLTREAEEIQKIVVFEGAFEKIFSIIKEEGGSEGGVVVQDSLELLKNLIRKNASNQILLRETVGFEPLISILKLHRGSAYNFTQQKTINLLSALETVDLLLIGGPEGDPGKDANRLSNQATFAQRKILDHLLMLGVESQWASLSVRCLALRCIGDLVYLNPQNCGILSSKVVGEEPQVEPALNSILRIILRTSTVQEFISADHVFKCFCERNNIGQAMLVSTMSSPLHSASTSLDSSLPFGSMLLHGLLFNETNGDIETSCRAASVLFHILKDNIQCKEQVLRVVFEAPVPSLGTPEPLMHRLVMYCALATSSSIKDNDQKSSKESGVSYVEVLILRLLVVWLADCPTAVDCFLNSPSHLTYLLDLSSNSKSNAYVRGLVSIILGECALFNKRTGEGSKDAFTVVDIISQKIGLTSYFCNFDDLEETFIYFSSAPITTSKPIARSSTASATDAEDTLHDERMPVHPILFTVFNIQFIEIIKKLEIEIRESIVNVFSNPKNKVVVLPGELEQNSGEPDGEYIKRLKTFIQKQCNEMQELLSRNATLAESFAQNAGIGTSGSVQNESSAHERIQSEMLRRNLEEATRRLETLKSEREKSEAEADLYKNLAAKMESELKSLSDAYNSLEPAYFQLESEVKALRTGGGARHADIEAIREEAREAAEKETEAELNDLLVCLGQEQSKVEKLSARLLELGEDVDSLLEGIGDETVIPDDDD